MEGRSTREHFVYIIAVEGSDLVKIGTSTNVPCRLDSMQTGNPYRLEIVFQWLAPDRTTAFSVENEAQYRLRDQRVSKNYGREWFRCGTAVASKTIKETIPFVTDRVVKARAERVSSKRGRCWAL